MKERKKERNFERKEERKGLSLYDIAQLVCVQSSDEAEKLILKMVSVGEIKAVVDQRTNMVRFSCMDVSTTRSADKPRENENAVVGLEKHIRETLQLSERKEEKKKVNL